MLQLCWAGPAEASAGRRKAIDSQAFPLLQWRLLLKQVGSPEMSISNDRETDFAEFSYGMHEIHEGNTIGEIPSLIARPDTIDAWRHQRIHDFLSPLHEFYKTSTWLSVGDSGSDAYYLLSKGLPHVTASSISSVKLERLKQEGYLQGADIKRVNAESMCLGNNSIDVILCKEAYHHFPRPAIAVYEFLRVAKQAVVLIEPNEPKSLRLLDFIKNVAKRLLRSQRPEQTLFESSGNFLYRLSLSELIKVCTALQLESVAFKFANDFYMRQIATKKRSEKIWMALQKLAIKVQDVLCRLRVMNYGLVIVIVPKKKFDDNLRRTLAEEGFKIADLPRNPYFSEAPQGAKA